MGTRQSLIVELNKFKPFDSTERVAVKRTIAFLESEPRAFERECLSGHLTASAFVIDESGEYLLLTHHRKLNKWLQLGGHCDGNEDTLAVARQEVWEEAGLQDCTIVDHIFDVHIANVPLYKGIPKHFHYDIRYLFMTKKTTQLSRREIESKELRWVKIDQLDMLWANQNLLKRIKTKLYSRIRK